MKRTKHHGERTCKPNLGKEGDAAAGIAGHQRSIPEDEPPALVARILGHVSQQASSLLIREREQG